MPSMIVNARASQLRFEWSLPHARYVRVEMIGPKRKHLRIEVALPEYFDGSQRFEGLGPRKYIPWGEGELEFQIWSVLNHFLPTAPQGMNFVDFIIDEKGELYEPDD